jgi:hypothetical protein
MSRLQDIVSGTRAIKRVKFPLVNCPSALTEPATELTEARAADIAAAKSTAETYPTHDTVGMRVLLPGEYATVLELTLAFAKAKGEENPNVDESPIYNLGKQIYVLAASCVDPDCPRNPDGSDRLYFGSGIEDAAEKIQSCVHMTRDTLAYLSEQWEQWCEHCNPQAAKIDFATMLQGSASEDWERFLSSIRPGLLLSFIHTMAAQLWKLLEAKSSIISISTPNSKPNAKSSPKKASSVRRRR